MEMEEMQKKRKSLTGNKLTRLKCLGRCKYQVKEKQDARNLREWAALFTISAHYHLGASEREVYGSTSLCKISPRFRFQRDLV